MNRALNELNNLLIEISKKETNEAVITEPGETDTVMTQSILLI
jgi:phage terminase small subunit